MKKTLQLTRNKIRVDYNVKNCMDQARRYTKTIQ